MVYEVILNRFKVRAAAAGMRTVLTIDIRTARDISHYSIIVTSNILVCSDTYKLILFSEKRMYLPECIKMVITPLVINLFI